MLNPPPAPPPGAPAPVRFELPPSFWSEWWPHLTAAAGAAVAVGLGTVDHFAGPTTGPMFWGPLVDLGLVYSGLAGMGLILVSAARS